MKSRKRIEREKKAVADIWNTRLDDEKAIDPIASAIHNTLRWVLGRRVYTRVPSEELLKLREKVGPK